MQNRFKELHSLFNVVIPVGLPGVLVDSKRFADEIAKPLQYGQKKDALPHQLAKVTLATFHSIRCGQELEQPQHHSRLSIAPQYGLQMLPSGWYRSPLACCPNMKLKVWLKRTA